MSEPTNESGPTTPWGVAFAWEVSLSGVVRVAVDELCDPGFPIGRPDVAYDGPRWDLGLPTPPAVLRRIFAPQPVVHLLDGVRGVQHHEDDRGALHIFMSPRTYYEVYTVEGRRQPAVVVTAAVDRSELPAQYRPAAPPPWETGRP